MRQHDVSFLEATGRALQCARLLLVYISLRSFGLPLRQSRNIVQTSTEWLTGGGAGWPHEILFKIAGLLHIG